MYNTADNKNGFTLLELLLALTIFMIVLGAIYATFLTQQKSYLIQEQIADVQQNLRAGMAVMERYIRMAGYDLTTTAGAGFSFVPGNLNGVPSDDNEDGDNVNKHITFTHVMLQDDGDDNDGNGQIDEAGELRTITFNYDSANNELDIVIDGEPPQAICNNIEYLEFQYLDQLGNILTGAALGGGANIRSVRIAMLAKSEKFDYDYTDTNAYNDLSGNPLNPDPKAGNDSDGIPNKHFRRRMLNAMVRCRNISWP